MKHLEVHFINHGKRHTWLRNYNCSAEAAMNHNIKQVLDTYPDARAIQVIAHTGHDFIDGFCTLCGQKETSA